VSVRRTASGRMEPIDAGSNRDHDVAVDDDQLDDELDDQLDPREAARDRRRDREAEAERRALMRPGMGKVFKQILDRHVRDADEPPGRRGRTRA
jgi:hypothetical protein